MKSDRGFLEHTRGTPEYVERHLHVLSDAELLGVVLAGGCVQENSTGLARGSLTSLAASPLFPERPGRCSGTAVCATPQASALLASYELASRLARQKIPRRRPLGRTDDVARFLRRE